jgi:hypothetical protein
MTFSDPFARQPAGPGQVLPEATFKVVLLHGIKLSDDDIDALCARLRYQVSEAAPEQIVGVMSGRDSYAMFAGHGKAAWGAWSTNLPGMFHMIVVPIAGGDARVGRGVAQIVKNCLHDRHAGLRAWDTDSGAVGTITELRALDDRDRGDPLQWAVDFR